ncbi:MAG: ATP-dependent DNA helicase RecG [Thermoanaerobaculia bacterium]
MRTGESRIPGRVAAIEASSLVTPLRFLRGVGPRRAELLAAGGLETVEDLLLVLPLRYEDRRSLVRVADIDRPGNFGVRGRLVDVRAVRTRRRGLVIVRARLEDGSGTLPVTWFNQPYLKSRIESGGQWLLYGAVRGVDWGLWEMTNPTCEALPDGAAAPSGSVHPVYGRLAGFSPANLSRLIATALELVAERGAPDPLPEPLRQRYSFPLLGDALRAVHAPSADADVELLNRGESPAHARLVYSELLEFQIQLAMARARSGEFDKGERYRFDDATRHALKEALPFQLTSAQRRVLKEIFDDLRDGRPMLRLVQGDVGSGKTILAALCLLLAAESGLQAAFMAPTELLAEQHFGNLRRLLGERARVELVTGNSPARLRKEVSSGEVAIVVGTHALAEQRLLFRNLGLAVIDEQHRFGVEQRRRLQAKGSHPDLLVMTATPIPRTLTLTVYGDLDVSLLDELPPGRKEIRTEVVPASERSGVYRRLREALAAGEQAYVVFPLIEESDEIEASSLEAMGARVRSYLGEFRSGVLHGRLPREEREATMRAFAAGELRVLVATTVIEVGVDVANATWMVIDGAERFGLAQLHQLRGRVGRGERPSICVAIHGRLSEEGRSRLGVFATTSDGFAIAEADLAIRGPGDLLGVRQAGMPRFRVADLAAHRAWLERSRQDAREIVPLLEQEPYRRLRERAEARQSRLAGQLAGG